MVESVSPPLFPVNETESNSNVTITEKDLDAMADAIAYLAKVGVSVFGEFWTVADPQVSVSGSQSNEYDWASLTPDRT